MYILKNPPEYTCKKNVFSLADCTVFLGVSREFFLTSSPIFISALRLPLCFSALQHWVFPPQPCTRAGKMLLINFIEDTGWIRTVVVSLSLSLYPSRVAAAQVVLRSGSEYKHIHQKKKKLSKLLFGWDFPTLWFFNAIFSIHINFLLCRKMRFPRVCISVYMDFSARYLAKSLYREIGWR